MKACGIVIEYNPMHWGHKHHIQQAKLVTQADIIIGVMSANFVQRGEPAIVSKFLRTEAALRNGVDIVIELPTIYSLQAADIFGKQAIKLLELSKVASVCFGSESNDIEILKEIANLSVNIDHFRERLDAGESYASAISISDDRLYPNDILAISYLRALKDTSITPYSIQRTNHYHSSNLTDPFLSASAIRQNLRNEKALEQSLVNLDNSITISDFYPLIRYKLLSSTSTELSKIFMVSEGIQNKLKKHAVECNCYEEFLENCVSRRYSKSRIQRILMHILLNHTKEQVLSLGKLNHLRVLGFTKKGRDYIKEKKLNISTKVSHIPKDYFAIEENATAIYSLISKEKDLLKKEVSKIMILE